MIFRKSPKVWKTDVFQDVIKQEIEELNSSSLPLQQALVRGSHVIDEPIKAVIIKAFDDEDSIKVKAGVFYSSIIAGCSCADDPTPIDTNQEYCELEFIIDKSTGEATVKLLEDS